MTDTTHTTPAAGVQIDAVQDLLSRIVDARAGFDTMVERAEPEFRAVALKFRETHHQHAERTAAIITALGGEADTSGSLMSTVNRTVVSLRALFDEIDEDVMDNVRDGERHVIEAFDEAIASMGNDRYREELVAMRGELDTLLLETAHLD
ncbi:DUF2383 domain-containing protein [Roseivivax isoporae]|uniref:DUF2383 domain-containing protein n=1 Tax=Roseivivax isoporae LMG 25204 TaxID=1449351 RepID=X7F707_9RHOB|nr:DUF2383 domain-containing protein [Roseivivax isoporae]ETX28493.1 hypothetical protein RISW2_06290 [Roseivivax isoporae LMG 25204]